MKASRQSEPKLKRWSANLGYFAGYYDSETRERVERLFKCSHPVFGAIAACGQPSVKEAWAAGAIAAKVGVKTAAKIFAK